MTTIRKPAAAAAAAAFALSSMAAFAAEPPAGSSGRAAAYIVYVCGIRGASISLCTARLLLVVPILRLVVEYVPPVLCAPLLLLCCLRQLK